MYITGNTIHINKSFVDDSFTYIKTYSPSFGITSDIWDNYPSCCMASCSNN